MNGIKMPRRIERAYVRANYQLKMDFIASDGCLFLLPWNRWKNGKQQSNDVNVHHRKTLFIIVSKIIVFNFSFIFFSSPPKHYMCFLLFGAIIQFVVSLSQFVTISTAMCMKNIIKFPPLPCIINEDENFIHHHMYGVANG